jgi:hypothetical protein
LKSSPSVWNVYLVDKELAEQVAKTPEVICTKKDYARKEYRYAVSLFYKVYSEGVLTARYYCKEYPPAESKKIPVKTIYNYRR